MTVSAIIACRRDKLPITINDIASPGPKETTTLPIEQPLRQDTLRHSHVNMAGVDEKDKKRTIVFLHPDLGIGGAERLVVDAAVGLQNRGHKVVIFTSHCDPRHCFDEARDGTPPPLLLDFQTCPFKVALLTNS